MFFGKIDKRGHFEIITDVDKLNIQFKMYDKSNLGHKK